MATLICAHGVANLTNRGPSELVEECIFYALQVRTRTIYMYYRLNIFFVVYSIINFTPLAWFGSEDTNLQ